MSEALLNSLGLTQTNAGTWSGDGGWLDDPAGKLIDSINPATGQVIARVRSTTPAQYERVMASAVAAARIWRSVPAPKRGEAVRLMGEELRQYKSKLGSLVSLEMGKIKAEGDGEVQEMIDIAAPESLIERASQDAPPMLISVTAYSTAQSTRDAESMRKGIHAQPGLPSS